MARNRKSRSSSRSRNKAKRNSVSRRSSAAKSSAKRSTSAKTASRPESRSSYRPAGFDSKALGATLSIAADNTERLSKAAFASFAKQAQSADQWMMGANAMRDWLSNAGEAKKAQDKLFSMSRESAEQMARSADAATRSLSEAVQIGQENMESCAEVGALAADMSKSISDEVMNYANNMLAQNVELSKDAMSCRTLSDVFELQSRAMRSNLDEFFSETAKLSEMMFSMASKISEPISDCVADATERMSKAFAA